MVQWLTILILIAIAVQDFRQRLVFWFFFPILSLLFFVKNQQLSSFGVGVSDIVFNFSIIGLILIYLKVFFSIRNKKWVKIIDEKIGLGDLLFFASLAFLFPIINFFAFLWLSFVSIVLVYTCARLLKLNTSRNIPLAGILSAFLIPIYAVEIYFNKIITNRTDWLTMLEF